ncbi:amidohydrolase [Altericroceibacterium endophyticum]|uniref:Amidohydrolase family protein n=1 Tax=Altericroceibacterium endophyticum TaxID=1808508 RepID=A0A6I4T9E1_9SPHN|nr:amidohydrolase [Altericroceibacterium endophyticum]MXO66490.1 amidohydrolase family protein [Altericroceibacterium endophyticum]
MMNKVTCLRAGAALSALAISALSMPAQADTLFDNINGMSISRDGKIHRFAAMVVGDDGRITHILKRDDKPPKDVEYREDGEGRVVLPGMVDSHLHLMGVGLATLSLDLSETRSLAEAQQKIAAYAARFPDRPWIVGRGWNQEQWGLDRFPSAAELDAAVADRPVWLMRVDGHAGWANSRALALAEITEQTENPEGGLIMRQAGSKAPAGVLVDAATSLVDQQVPPPRPEDRDLALYNAQTLLTAQGVTAAADMGTSIEDWMTYRRAGDTGHLTIRIMSYAASLPEMLLIGGTGPTPWLYQDRLRLNGIKLYLDGALGSRGAALKQPYADDPGNSGLQLLNGTQLRNLMSRAAMDNFQVAIHAIGDFANAEVLDAVDELSESYEGDRRWRIEHAQIVDPVDIPRFGQHGTIASMQPIHQTSDRLMAEARLGPDRLAGAYAWRSIAATGAPLAFGSDAPVEAPDPFAGIAAAMSRADAQGQPFGGWQPQETVSLGQPLAAYTSVGAYAGFGEGRFGELKEGQHADFIVVDRDPALNNPEDIRETRVLQTWIGGVKVYDARDGMEELKTETEDDAADYDPAEDYTMQADTAGEDTGEIGR